MTQPPDGYMILKIGVSHYPMIKDVYPDGSFTLTSLKQPGTTHAVAHFSKRVYAVAFCYSHQRKLNSESNERKRLLN